ncbi:PQQ-binding-like beta-propeller repeat protein [Patescibacteria group bacterium]|nr:PQQ-binding-like beta-propeller repeat protein [Patescibacteria group bacterium]
MPEKKSGYSVGVKHAEENPSQIGVYAKEAVSLMDGLGSNLFHIRAELYSLLGTAKTNDEQFALLQSYMQGLDDVGAKGRINLWLIWSHFEKRGIYPRPIIQDGYVIFFDNLDDDDRKAGSAKIHRIDMATGKTVWSYTFKRKKIGAFQHYIVGKYLFCRPQYLGDSDSAANPQPFCLDTETGNLLWEYRQKGDRYGIEQLMGAFQNLFIASTWAGVVAINPKTGKIEWEIKADAHNCGDIISSEEQLIIKTKEREVSWVSPKGKVFKKCKLPFPIKDEGYIYAYRMADDGECLYLAVRGHDYSDTYREKSVTIIYKINKSTGKKERVARLDDFLCWGMVLAGKTLYVSDEERSYAIDLGSSNRPVEMPYYIWAENNGDLLCVNKQHPILETPQLTIMGERGSLWTRDGVYPLAVSKNLIFCEERPPDSSNRGKNLVILDQKTGKELAKVIDSSRYGPQVFLINETRFLLLEDKKASLHEIRK